MTITPALSRRSSSLSAVVRSVNLWPRCVLHSQAVRQAAAGLAVEYGRYGYRRITALLRADGWRVNHKRVERIWRQEGLKVPAMHPKRGRLWLSDSSCIRLRPTYGNHVWAYDFVF